ncbi:MULTISPECIES: hypothetical protein [unclassified Bosea (in: a-proteobacteria)]|uniref:hypothetical protein n=1 Tax=unclassified Bosea (in: a-proteobacteria) TaxID=2653178 RepID=UPI001253371D|nr:MULTISPECIES: hypothetical protein [unclassified Bosea (in: a-proteobacteria)]CAD5255598.1 conserved hypothetical protein [Bosea sp. 21B]CAD5284617.1 conserved hypothetical protein [Bosea sp. 7B]VVT57804.1 conserved hypothetical protein [Bosea sp. EC-HK365B]VXC91791.1 conserved hypothetical protein [Bosea sp. 127]
MTLVAGLSVGGLPAFVSDLLISWRLPSQVDLPTQWSQGVHPGLGKDHAAGLAQKLVIVRPYLMIAWAGQRASAETIIRELDRILPKEWSDTDDFDKLFKVVSTCSKETEMLVLFISKTGVQPFCVRTQGFELDGQRIYLLGSGAPSFFEFLQNSPGILPEQEQADGLLARANMLRFAARSLVLQLVTGAGLKESWGGGFEVAYPDKKGFQKVGNIMFRAWMIDEGGALHNSGKSFFSRYYGNDLYLSCFSTEEKTYVIRSPIGEIPNIPEYEEIHPDWILDFFILKKNGALIEFARYQYSGKPSIDLVQLANGALVGWALDQHYVEQCAAKAMTVAEQGNCFQMFRSK